MIYSEEVRLERDALLAENARLRAALRSVRKNIPEGCSTAFEIINAALTGVERMPTYSLTPES